jgi:putative transposase
MGCLLGKKNFLSFKTRRLQRCNKSWPICVDCGYENHADVVGAINILARGHRVLACGEPVQSGRSVKQEPAEVIQYALC